MVWLRVLLSLAPLQVLLFFWFFSGGVACANHRLMAVKPTAWLILWNPECFRQLAGG
jgi:hypothetical protein